MASRANLRQLSASQLSCRPVPRLRSPFLSPASRPQHSRQQLPLLFRTVTTTESATESAPKPAPQPAPKPAKRPFKQYAWITAFTLGAGCGFVYFTDTRASAHQWLIPPLLRWLFPDAEDAHHFGVDMLRVLYRFGLHPRERGNPDGDGKLVTQVRTHATNERRMQLHLQEQS